MMYTEMAISKQLYELSSWLEYTYNMYMYILYINVKNCGLYTS